MEKRVFHEGSDVKASDPLYVIAAAPFQAVDSALDLRSKAAANLLAARSKANRFEQLAALRSARPKPIWDRPTRS